jgi:hypothetical protein
LKHKLRVSVTYRYSEFTQFKLRSESVKKGSAPAPAVRFPPLDNGFVPIPTEVGGDWRPAAAPERGEEEGEAVLLSCRGEPLETRRRSRG